MTFKDMLIVYFNYHPPHPSLLKKKENITGTGNLASYPGLGKKKSTAATSLNQHTS